MLVRTKQIRLCLITGRVVPLLPVSADEQASRTRFPGGRALERQAGARNSQKLRNQVQSGITLAIGEGANTLGIQA